MIYIGIDPGKTKGAMAYFGSHDKQGTMVFPKIGTEFDILAFDKIVKQLMDADDCHFVLEDIGVIFGTSKTTHGTMMHNKGQIEGILVANGCPYTLVKPKVWQKEMFEGVKLQRKASSGKKKDGTPKQGAVETKKTALLACKRLFPGISLLATERCSTPHDGIVDAVLMAEYCRRKFK